MQIDTIEIINQPVILRPCAGSGFGDENTGIEIKEIVAGTTDFQSANDGFRCIDGNRIARAGAVKHGSGFPLQHDCLVNDD